MPSLKLKTTALKQNRVRVYISEISLIMDIHP